jgi:hypothetical protein
MSESSAPQLPTAGAGVPSQSLISTTLVVYALFAVAAIAGLVSAGLLSTPLLGLLGLIALIIAYVKRGEGRRNLVAVALPLADPHVLVFGIVEHRGVAGRRDADRHTDRNRHLDRDHDLGSVPVDTRISAVQREQAGTGNVTGSLISARRGAPRARGRTPIAPAGRAEPAPATRCDG